MREFLLEKYGALIIDLDGVVYLLNEPIPGSIDAVRRFQVAEIPLVFLTNNSSSTTEQYVSKLSRLGIDVSENSIVTSSQAVAKHLGGNCAGRRALVIGEVGLTSTMEALGLELVDSQSGDADVDFVIVGWDREFHFNKLKAAVLAIRRGASFIATNADATYPTPEGLWPGAGAIVAAVSTGSDCEPFVAGKPNPLIVKLALERMGKGARETLLIGDRLDTDIQAGISAGVETLLVLTGISGLEDIEKTGIRPTHIRESLGKIPAG